MQIELQHRFDAPLQAVLEALASDAYPRYLAERHSFFEEIQPLSLSVTRTRVERTLRYRARPFIARLGLFALPAAWFVWVEHSVLDRSSGVLSFDNVPALASVRDRVINRGTMQFTAPAEGGTLRTARFEIGFEVGPMYRPLAELALSMVARQLQGSLDEEARLLESWLCATPGTLALTA